MTKLVKAETALTPMEVSTCETELGPLTPQVRLHVSKEVLPLVNCLPDPDPKELVQRQVFLGPSNKKNVLVLDLDETLVVSIQLEGMEELGLKDNIAIRVRPYAQELLQRLHTVYELVVFTAAEETYAKMVVDLLDPAHEWITKVLTREHCVPLVTGGLVKDLRIFADRSLAHVLIVDNNLFNFAYQLGNGIPITSYDGANDDSELVFLADYLEKLSLEPNPVAINSVHIGLQPRVDK